MDSTKQDTEHLKQSPKEFHELLTRLKWAAIYPSNPEFLSKSRRQILSARRALVESNPGISWNKRKCRQLLPQKRSAACGLPSKLLKKQRSTTSNQVHTFSPCSTPNVIHVDSVESPMKILSPSCSSSELLESSSSFFRNPVSQNITEEGVSESTASDQVISSSFDTANQIRQEEPVRPVSIDAPVQNKKSGCISSQLIHKAQSKEEPCRRSNRINCFIGDVLQEKASPVGEHFQASIPEWTGKPSDHYKLDTSKWLGQKIWPVEDTSLEIGLQLIGKGRQDSLCSCTYRDSADCIRRHICEVRTRLQFEIGDAFYSWGFDRMGESICEEWTLNEQNDFNNLFKRKTTKSKKNFWKRVSKVFPLKHRKIIVNYYFNVFVLKNIRRRVSMHAAVIDSDDDEIDKKELKFKAQKGIGDDPFHDWEHSFVADFDFGDVNRKIYVNRQSQSVLIHRDKSFSDPDTDLTVVGLYSGMSLAGTASNDVQPIFGEVPSVTGNPIEDLTVLAPRNDDLAMLGQSPMLPFFIQIASKHQQEDSIHGELEADRTELAVVKNENAELREEVEILRLEKNSLDAKVHSLEVELEINQQYSEMLKKHADEAIRLLSEFQHYRRQS